MNEMILAGLPKEFDELAVRAMMGDDVEAELAILVARTRVASGTDADWQQRVEKVRGRLMGRLGALSIPQAGLPIKLEDSHIQSERAFYADAVVHLSILIETT